ncbi:MAG: hypothetical protein JSS69_01955 [Acidobacteria bacterium]|nr:hypothetical protein [Acidobacteriota bacterium]MBS1864657.1 hypothetical protein [Acidobacteriota bacterium]
MNLKRLLLAFGAAIVLIFVAAANAANSPLPFSILTARTIYIDNQSGFAELTNVAYLELSRWARFEPVESAAKADLTIVLTGSSYVRVVAENERPLYDAKKVSVRPAELPEAAPAGFTRVTLQDVKTGKTLWSGLVKTDGPRVKGKLIEGFREAYDQTDKIRYKR